VDLLIVMLLAGLGFVFLGVGLTLSAQERWISRRRTVKEK